MKTNILKNMKQYTKYICAVVLMLGMSVSAWGTTLHYGVGGSSTMTYTSPTALPGFDDVGSWESTDTWITYEITSAGSYDYAYGTYYGIGHTSYAGITDLYALYQKGGDYITRPIACTSQGVIVTDDSDEDEGEGDYGILTTFNLSVESDGSGAVTWSTSDANVATVSGNNSTATVTVVGAGLVDITASVAADATYCAEEGTYSLLVNAVAPTLSHNASGKELTVSGITSTGATFTGGVVTDKGGADITRYGFTIGTSSTVVIGGTGANAPVASSFWDDDITLNTAFGSKTSVSNFSPNTTYYVRAFAYNGSVYGYSTAVQFKTLKQFTITLDGNGVSDGIAAVEENAAELIEITAPTRDHYTLEGYYTTSECDTKIANTAGELAASITVGGNNWTDGDGKWIRNTDETFYANWTPDNHTISFNANGGSGSMDNVVRAYNTTYNLPACTFTAPDGKVFDGWAEGSAEGTVRAVGYSHTVAGNITFYAKWRDGSYTDAKFSCADWSITGPSGDIVFITSAASKTVRSQEAFHVSGSGLPHSTALTFTTFPVNTKFEFKKADGTIPQTNEFGVVDADVYAFYTPDAGDTSDGLDELTSLTVSVTGEPRTATIDTKRVIGRHLPADFVIAGKKNNKWYALPSDMASTTNPKPSEIAVNDINNPSIAYTAATNIYGLAGPTASNVSGGNGQYVRLTMSIDDGTLDPHAAPLFGSATGTRTIGKSGNSQASSDLSAGWWWSLTQTNTSITNPQDAKYTIKCANNTSTLSLRDNAGDPDWGLFASGVEELRLIPASDVVPTEAYFVEWGQHGGVVEVDAQGVAATSVVAHLNGESSSAITLVQTKAGDAKNKSSKYNYTVNFGDDIDFADAASNGAMLTLEWKNGATVKAVSNIIVPKIVASNITINKANYTLKSYWNTEVHVLPGKTVTVDPSAYDGSNVTIKELNIYPGATVVASTGTLIATNLVLRNGWSRAGEKTYDVARLYVTASTATLKATNVYADWYIDYDQYYPVAVPWNATVANFTYRYCTVSPTVGYDKNIRLRYYDGDSRATNVQTGVGEGANWKAYGDDDCDDVPDALLPSHGYIMTAKRPSGKAFSIIRMPLTLPSGTWGEGTWTTNGESGAVSETHKDQIAVTAHNTGSTPIYAQGWNLIANPYMAIYKGTIEYADETKVQYVNIPDVDFKEYNQLPTATTKLAPASAFLIQAPKTGTITFGTAKRVPSAPSYRKENEPESIPEQQAYIVLNNEQTEDMMGILVSDQYTAEYEINADLEKLLGDGTSLRTYMRYGDRNMAYLAINKVLAQEWIPVSVRLPQTGEYTFSLHEASIAGELEGVYLIDYANGDRVTNLINENYVFTAEAGTINGRFAINATVGERQTPTEIDVVGADKNGDEPIKFLYHDKVFIWHRGVIYDATGKKVREINK